MKNVKIIMGNLQKIAFAMYIFTSTIKTQHTEIHNILQTRTKHIEKIEIRLRLDLAFLVVRKALKQKNNMSTLSSTARTSMVSHM